MAVTDAYQIITSGTILYVVYDDAQMVIEPQVNSIYALTGGKTYYIDVANIEPCTYILRVSGKFDLYNYAYKLGISWWKRLRKKQLLTAVYENPPELLDEISVKNGQDIAICISADQISSFDGMTFTLVYDAEKLRLTDLAGKTYEKEISATTIGDITITNISNGKITFTIAKDIPTGKVFSGVLNVFLFDGIESGNAQIGLDM